MSNSQIEYANAEKFGRKVETITLEQFHNIPFMCGDGNIDGCVRKYEILENKIKNNESW